MSLLLYRQKSGDVMFLKSGEEVASFLLGRPVDQYQVFALVELVLPADPEYTKIQKAVDAGLETTRRALSVHEKGNDQ